MKKHTVIKQEINDNRKKIQELQELIRGKEQNEKMLIKAYEDKHSGNCTKSTGMLQQVCRKKRRRKNRS